MLPADFAAPMPIPIFFNLLLNLEAASEIIAVTSKACAAAHLGSALCQQNCLQMDTKCNPAGLSTPVVCRKSRKTYPQERLAPHVQETARTTWGSGTNDNDGGGRWEVGRMWEVGGWRWEGGVRRRRQQRQQQQKQKQKQRQQPPAPPLLHQHSTTHYHPPMLSDAQIAFLQPGLLALSTGM